MKILVTSDSHGNIRNLQKVVNQYGVNADVVVFCGDGPRGDATWLKENCTNSTVVAVRGNCDFGNCELRDVEMFNVAGKNIMVTHGHLYSAKYGLEKLSYAGEEKNADIVFFGHTQIPTDEIMGNVRLINPGSCSYYNPTCCVVEIDDKGNVLVNHLKVPK